MRATQWRTLFILPGNAGNAVADAGNIRYECGQYQDLNYFRRGIFTL